MNELKAKEILDMCPGEELDKIVAGKLQGALIKPSVPVSTDISAAWLVVDYMLRQGHSPLINWLPEGNVMGPGWHCIFKRDPLVMHVAHCKTAPEAICKAALLTLNARGNK